MYMSGIPNQLGILIFNFNALSRAEDRINYLIF